MKKNKLKLGIIELLLAAFSVPQLHAVKIGVLHSLSGTMAISETSLKDVVMMDQQSSFLVPRLNFCNPGLV